MPEIAATFADGTTGDLDSFLIEITANVLAKTPDRQAARRHDAGPAGQKGTGSGRASTRSTGRPAHAITEAVFARSSPR